MTLHKQIFWWKKNPFFSSFQIYHFLKVHSMSLHYSSFLSARIKMRQKAYLVGGHGIDLNGFFSFNFWTNCQPLYSIWFNLFLPRLSLFNMPLELFVEMAKLNSFYCAWVWRIPSSTPGFIFFSEKKFSYYCFVLWRW